MRPFAHLSILILLLPMTVLALASCSLPPVDGSTRLEGRRISEVRIIYQGRETVNVERLRRLMAMKEGSVYSKDAADEDIKSLYESGLVDDVIIRKESYGSEVRVRALITTSTGTGQGPYFAIIGNSSFSDQKLFKEGFKGIPPRFWSRVRAEVAARKMRGYYRRMGFTEAEVTLDRQRSKMGPWHAWENQAYYLQVEEGPRTGIPLEYHTPMKTWRTR